MSFDVGRRLRRKHRKVAVNGVSLSLHPGETLALVGESGCGKTTFAHTVMRALTPTSGQIWFGGQDLANLGDKELIAARRRMALVFQNPSASLNPKRRIGDSVAVPLRASGEASESEIHRLVGEALEEVELDRQFAARFPAELSGGQIQRVALARALISNPELLVCDEIFTALDSSTQAEIVNLLADLKEECGLACLFIAHDLESVRQVSDRVAVMSRGRVVEAGETDQVLGARPEPGAGTEIH